MSSELADAEADVVRLRNLLERAQTAASYSTGDVSVTRQSVETLRGELNRAIRLRDQLRACELGVTNPSVKVVDLS